MQTQVSTRTAGLIRPCRVKAGTHSWGQLCLLHSSAAVQNIRSQQLRAKSSQSKPQAAVDAVLSVDIPTVEARSCLRFQAVPSGTGQAIVVSAVAEGSSPEEAGVRRGMKLVGISDPIREYEVWDLQDRPSLRYVRDVLRMRSSNSITLRFLEVAELLQALEAADGTISLTTTNNNSSSSNDGSSTPISGSTPLSSIDSISSLASISDSDGSTIAERLQQQYEQAQQGSSSKPLTGVEQREQRRKSYMEQVGQRNDSGFLAVLAASFLLPALVILAVAYSTGYLDSMYSNSLYTAR
ncbi:hypothetical protein OEZ85_002830 [Tetradesmus obliquus]|uniref:PDZ domain-containing protein n=1 Tax=Tetradesmus obliquus TaxID=3088 RepID=A0ABY8U2X5_TETOB|nr:hypothetical protein OEZ85_002830 [Tetradesmus obliquus]